MLDKTIPYFDVIMVRPAGAEAVRVPELPQGYAYRLYQSGDIAGWSRVEHSVDEFDTQAQARGYFMRSYLRHPRELPRRMVFITGPDGLPVATASAWWTDDERLGRVAQLHWVGAMPQVQGKGLGRAVTCKALSLFDTVGPAGDIWLTTQTWSHVAIGLYLSLGFCAHRSYGIAGHTNGFAGAVDVLRGVMPRPAFARFMDTAVG